MTRHRFDPLSFIFGALFVAVAAVGLIDRQLVTVTDLRWVAPGLLVALGALLLVLSGRRTGSDGDGAAVAESRDTVDTSPDVDPDLTTTASRYARSETAVEGDDPER